MTAREHLQPELFDPGPRLSAEEQDAREHERMGQQVAAFGELSVSVPTSVVPDIQRVGSIRTQHETNRSQGAFNPQLRHERETEMGYSEAPVYGYFSRSPSEDAPYGDTSFHLKSEVKDRTYMMPGDSLNAWSVPDTARASEVAAGREKAPQPIFPVNDSSYEDVPYVEAHILPDERPETVGMGSQGYTSRVPLEDVSRVSICEGGLRFDPEGKRRDESRVRNFQVGGDLEREGIPVEHVLTDIVEQPSLPMEYRDKPSPPTQYGTRKRRVRHQDLGSELG